MIDLTVRLTVALGAAALLNLALRRQSAAVRHHVWLVTLLALPLVAWTPRLTASPMVAMAVQAAGGIYSKRSAAVAVDWWRIGWQVGTALLLARLALAHWACARMTPRSGVVTAPMAYGLFRPAILLPEAARDWPAERRACVMAHEQAHLDRGDLWAQLSIEIVTALFWWHPLVWLARRQAVVERERACDDRVIASGVAAPADYATHLLAVARGAFTVPAAALSTTHVLERRLNAMLDPTINRARLGRRQALTATAGLLTLLAPATLLRGQEEYHKTDELTEAPRLLHKVEPEYSEAARDAKVAGKCVLEIGIDKNGIVAEAKVIEPLHPDLDVNAIEAVKQWTFRPGAVKGKPVGVRARVEVNFRLR